MGTPPKVVEVLTRAMKKVIESPEHGKKLDEIGLQSVYMDPAAYEKIWIDVEARVKPIIEQMQAK
jgi:tripartite-type tricarboxylate transporter receptor subunit TctC